MPLEKYTHRKTYKSSWNYEELEELDYIDTTLKTGILFPTGARKNQNLAFDLPSGYDGYYALPFSTDASLGAFEWLTVGYHTDVLFFIPQTRTIRMKTDLEQSGFFKLGLGTARVRPGSLWNINGYLKADHLAKGFSLLVGYTYSQKNDDTICPCNRSFVGSIVNSDEMFKSWNMHTLHLQAEYDFTQEEKSYGFRAAIFYNQVLGGKRIFKTNMAGGSLGVDIGLRF